MTETDSRLENLILTRQHGSDLSVSMGGLLFKDLATCFEELVANSHDADAENVRIVYNPDRGLLVFEDDGDGMDGNGLKNFYRMGESPKRKQTLTKKGRKPIGKFGIASLVLRTLGVSYTLETWKDGVQYTVKETFSSDDTDSKPIKVFSSKVSSSKHGTRIAIDKLKFLDEGRDVDLHSLTERFSGGKMLLLPDFALYLNDKLIKPRSIENGVEYVVDAADPVFGELTGSIWYSSKPLDPDVAAIYINVNGRPVGGRNLDFFATKASLARRIYGVLNADGLDKIVGFDRDGFLRDHPQVRGLRSHIKSIVKQIRMDNEADSKNKDLFKARQLVAQITPEVGKFIGDCLDEDRYSVEFNAQEAGEIARLDRKNNIFYINPGSEFFTFSRLNITSLRTAFYHAVKYAIVSNMIQPNRIRDFLAIEKKVTDSLEEKARTSKVIISLAKIVADRDSKSAEVYRISPSRFYDFPEVTRLFGLENHLLKRIVSSGLLKESKGKLLGKDVVELVDRLEGQVTLFDAIRRLYVETPYEPATVFYSNKETAAVKKLDSIVGEGKPLPNYISNLAENENFPFYVIRERALSRLKYFLDNWSFPGDGMFGDKIYCHAKTSDKSKSVVICLLEVKGKPELNFVKEGLSGALEFVTDNGSLPAGLISRSFYSEYDGTNYAVVVYAGQTDKIVSNFERNGFTSVDIDDKKIPTLIYQGARIVATQKKTREIPLENPPSFTRVIARTIDLFYS